jgi:hypothetical protein
MDREQMQRCLEVVAAYRASGQKSKAWAQANGVPERSLASWCAHSRRWQARLDGVVAAPLSKPSGFVAAHVAPSAASATVRVEMTAGDARLDLHWPLAHTRELATLMRELGR